MCDDIPLSALPISLTSVYIQCAKEIVIYRELGGQLLSLLFTVIYALFIHWTGSSGIYFVGTRVWRGKSNTQAIQIRPEPLPASFSESFIANLPHRLVNPRGPNPTP